MDPLAVVLFTVTDWLKYTSGPASAADRQRTIITALLTITVHPTGQGRPFDAAASTCCSVLLLESGPVLEPIGEGGQLVA